MITTKFGLLNRLEAFKMESGQWCVENRGLVSNDSFADIEGVTETGCLSIVVLGASGDLAKKKTFPALFNLYRQVLFRSSFYSHAEIM